MDKISIQFDPDEAILLGDLLTDMGNAVMSNVPAGAMRILTKALKQYSEQCPSEAPRALETLGFVSQLIYQLQHHFNTICVNQWTFNKLSEGEITG